MMMRLPENTKKRAEDNPMEFLAMASIMGSSAAINHQEDVGQRDFCYSDALPSDMRYDCRKVLETLGTKFGEVDPSDPLFIPCTLPADWSKQPTNHSMWSDLLDEKGRKRGAIFYKAAFYDRKAWMTLLTRFSYDQDYDREDAVILSVTDCGKVIHTIWPVFYAVQSGKEGWRRRSEASEKAQKLVEAWFAEHYPDWQNPAAYWD